MDRQRKIVEELHIAPTDAVLEIGCGQGVAGTYVCRKLTTGNYVGVDRSQKMIDAALRRNQEFIAEGKATFTCQELENLDLGNQKFNQIFAVRVGLFHREPERAKQLVNPYLAPGGKLTVIYDTPS